MSDLVLIRDLTVRGIIGVNADERTQPQDIVINIELATDVHSAGESDCLDDAVDYAQVAHRVTALAESLRSLLVERLATEIARLCLEYPTVKSVRVRVEKPGALENARSAGIEIVRSRADFAPAAVS